MRSIRTRVPYRATRSALTFRGRRRPAVPFQGQTRNWSDVMPPTPEHHSRAQPSGSPPTTLTTPRLDRWVMFLGLPATGVVLSLLLPVLARRLLDLGTGLPVKPVFWFLGEIDNWWRVMVAAAVGALVGLGSAVKVAKRTASVTVGDADLVVEVGGRRRTWFVATSTPSFSTVRTSSCRTPAPAAYTARRCGHRDTPSRGHSASAATDGWRATRTATSTGRGALAGTSCPPRSTRCSPPARRHLGSGRPQRSTT